MLAASVLLWVAFSPKEAKSQEPISAPVVATSTPPTNGDLESYATDVALQHGLNPTHFTQVIACESNWDAHALGDYGTSYGLVQIHNPVERGISIAQADNPTWAINWMANEWEQGQEYQWSCYSIREAAGWK